jgi:NAD(P)H-hydrate epimerase
MLVTPSQMKAAEAAAFSRGVVPAELMDLAGEEIARVIRQFFPDPGTAIFYCGKGYNAADTLVAARHLGDKGWNILLRLSVAPDELALLTRERLSALSTAEIIHEIPQLSGAPLVLVDGLLGIGSTGVPRGATAGLIREVNDLRCRCGGFSVSIDLPSGLEGSTGEVFEPCIQADLTVTLGAVKTGLIADRATAVVGRIAVIPLPGLAFPDSVSAEMLTAELLRPLLPTRNFDTHKGNYGRIGILAGSRGTLGAARLAAAAAVHAGGGLVTLYALPECFELLASSCIPEVMVRPVSTYLEVLTENHDVLAIGPGLGRGYDADLLTIIRDSPLPCVIDADALNAVSAELPVLQKCAGPRLLTPHPGEMERLLPQSGRSRSAWASDFVQQYPVTLLLKGSRTIVAERGAAISYNTTGNPGMGSGGMGDVLTGVCSALVGSGHELRQAGMLGAWLCGRAAEIAIFNGENSQESLSATSVISHLGAASHSLRNGDY